MRSIRRRSWAVQLLLYYWLAVAAAVTIAAFIWAFRDGFTDDALPSAIVTIIVGGVYAALVGWFPLGVIYLVVLAIRNRRDRTIAP